MATLSLSQRIAEAQAAYHALQTGAMPRVVQDMNGEKVEFAAANSGKLYSYILELQRQAGVGSTVAGGPMQFIL